MRKARGWSQQHAFKELRTGLRLSENSRASYVALDMGDRAPRPDEVAFLVDFFGESPGPADAEGEAAVASPGALDALVAAINALVDEMRLARERDQDAAAAMVRAAEVLLSARQPQEDEASRGHGAPLGTGR